MNKYLEFEEIKATYTVRRKQKDSDNYYVYSRDNYIIGTLKYHSIGEYVLRPFKEFTEFSKVELKEIASFLDKLNKKHREDK